MEHFLVFLSLILVFIMLSLVINEKTIKKPNEIFLLGASLIVGLFFFLCKQFGFFVNLDIVIETIDRFRIDKVLMDILLCFMLFSGASELKLNDLIKNFKPISLLAFGTTVISSCLFGAILYGVSVLFGIGLSYTTCVLAGAIISPTDPIAATGILNKLGLSEDVIATMEGESLFNDGTGVALFIFIKNLIEDTASSNFFVIMIRELGGAIIIGLLVSFVFFFIMKHTTDPIKLVIISLAAVTVCYSVCEKLECSGVIATVVCGIYFSTMKDKLHTEVEDLDPHNWYNDFWHIIDNLLNYILYVLMGISLIYLSLRKYAIIIAIVSILGNIIARFIGVHISSVLVKKNPGGFNNFCFTILMTGGGLKGGLCLALALSTNSFLDQVSYDYIIIAAFAIVVFTTMVQGLTISSIYKKICKTCE